MSERFVTVWCGEWPVVAAGVAPDQPAAVFHANRVVARTPAAAKRGVAHGERRRAAQRACPELQVLTLDPDSDARRFEPIVRAVAELAPRVEVVEPGWLCLAARGPSRYFGGDGPLADRLVELVGQHAPCARVDGGVRVGVADGRTASAIAARTAPGTRVVDPGGSAAFLADRSVAWLARTGDITTDLVDLFVRLGLRTFGQVAALRPADLLSRFGPPGLLAHQIATGTDARLSVGTDPSSEWSCEHPFDEPVGDAGPVIFVAKRLADDLAGQLGTAGQVCTRLVVAIETEHGERSERTWYRAHGLSAAAIVERVRWQLSGWVDDSHGGDQEGDRPTAGIVLLRLTPSEVRIDSGEQIGLWGGHSQADVDAARAVARLSGMVGEGAVRVPEWVGGRLPHERYRLVPATSVDLDDPGGRLGRGAGPWPGSASGPAPATVLAEPVAADVLDAAGEVVRVTGRGDISAAPDTVVLAGVARKVTGWAGPWPVDQRWWSPIQARRVARLQVLTASGDAYLLAVERGNWYALAAYT
ncbi:MAG TPA: DNA polymerase Y family protein [Ilumatobacter sp.]|nr:DNA polymerase Y family protein [Ilumatobacter sp.]